MWPSFANHPEALGLLEVATSRPLDRLPRLILSDWLEEHGEGDVAEVIRTTIWGCDRWAFPQQIMKRWKPWNGCYKGWLAIYGYKSTDFIESPWVNAISIWDKGGDCLASLHKQTHLTRIQSSLLADDDLEYLVPLTRLADLSLPCSQITDAGLIQLARITSLKSLNLGRTKITDAGLTHLRNLVNLRCLRLCGTAVTAAGVAQLVDMAGLEVEADIR